MAHVAVALCLSGAAVVTAGILLGWAADEIASSTELGEMWTGWIMLAAATSLPEFVTDVSAVRLRAARLAAGDLFGSSLTNMAILAVITLAFVEQNRRSREGSQNRLCASLAIALTLLGAFFTLIHSNVGWMRLRPESLLILMTWLAGTRVMYGREHAQGPGDSVPDAKVRAKPRIRLPYLPIAVFLIGSVMIFAVAPRFAASARQFAALSGLGDSFVGIWLLGTSTALPDFVTCLTACRLGAYDLAVASLYGSCAFNMVVFFAMDLASPVSVFSRLDPVLSISGFLAVILMTVGWMATSSRRGALLLPELGGSVLLASYGVAIWAVYALREDRS
jgi:cation:H+ antiporter